MSYPWELVLQRVEMIPAGVKRPGGPSVLMICQWEFEAGQRELRVGVAHPAKAPCLARITQECPSHFPPCQKGLRVEVGMVAATRSSQHPCQVEWIIPPCLCPYPPSRSILPLPKPIEGDRSPEVGPNLTVVEGQKRHPRMASEGRFPRVHLPREVSLSLDLETVPKLLLVDAE
jgi:hypothetical protein